MLWVFLEFGNNVPPHLWTVHPHCGHPWTLSPITAQATVWSYVRVSLSISKEKHISIIDYYITLIDYKYT